MLQRALSWVIFALLAAAGCGSEEASAFDCGTPPNVVGCKQDEICVAKEHGGYRTYECVENPCGTATLSCEKCAAPACGGFVCGNAHDRTLDCYCLSC